MSSAVVVMAAGLGTRMRSATVKVLHPVAGRPMIHYPVRSALALGAERVVVVLGHQRDRVEAYLKEAFPAAPVTTALQEQQLGTAHAVLCARDALADFDGHVYILSGDVPNLSLETIQALERATGDAAVGLITMRLSEPAAYGRIIRDADGRVRRITEAKDCAPEQLKINEVNAGIYRVRAKFLFETLAGLGRDNAQGEYYLTDLVERAADAGLGVEALVLEGEVAETAHGVNDRLDLARAEARMQAELRAGLMRAGVSMIDPSRVTLHDGVEVGPDTTLEPDVMLLGATRVGRGCVLEQGVRLTDTEIGDEVHLLAYSVAGNAKVGARAHVGPFARLREGTVLHEDVRIGNFVETKKTEMGKGAKANHLAYIGDATVGAGSNLGAGTITCNYDGVNKHRTVLGEGVFIGSDTQLVAPVTVGDGAYVGAGSTITAEVPAGALALSRVPQRIIEGWAVRRREKLRKKA